MRIQDINQSSSSTNKNISGEAKKDSTAGVKLFKRELSSLNQEKHQQYISSLIDEITDQGHKISKKADMSEMQKYRELIIELIQENVNNSFAFEKKDKFDSRGRHMSFAMIRKVNEKLDELTSEVLKEQNENIKIVDLVDDIRGILVDLFM